jgi:hypothetical protein
MFILVVGLSGSSRFGNVYQKWSGIVLPRTLLLLPSLFPYVLSVKKWRVVGELFLYDTPVLRQAHLGGSGGA